MSSKFNDAIELFESLSIEEQEEILELERKRILEKRRMMLLNDIKEAEEEIKSGKFITGTPEELMNAIDEEVSRISGKK